MVNKMKAKIKPWISRKSYNHTDNYYSVINKLIRERKIDNKFVEQVSGLSLEDLIAVKLEQSNRLIAGKLYALPIFFSIPRIAKDACIKYALSCTRTFREAAAFLGVGEETVSSWRKSHNIDLYFGDKDEKSTSSK